MAGTRQSGRRPTPTALLPNGSRSLNDRAKEPMPTEKLGKPPEYLNKEELNIWKSLKPKLLSMGVGTNVDEDAFARYCVLYSTWIEIKSKLRDCNYGFNDEAQTRRSGMLNNWLDIGDRLIRLETKFGLTPADRVGLGRTQGKNDGEHGNSKRAKFFGKGA